LFLNLRTFIGTYYESVVSCNKSMTDDICCITYVCRDSVVKTFATSSLTPFLLCLPGCRPEATFTTMGPLASRMCRTLCSIGLGSNSCFLQVQLQTIRISSADSSVAGYEPMESVLDRPSDELWAFEDFDDESLRTVRPII
jgi:hypothetical protein